MLDFNPTTDFRLLMAVPLIPLLGYIVQIFFGKHLPRKGDWMLTGGMFVVMCITVYLGFKAIAAGYRGEPFVHDSADIGMSFGWLFQQYAGGENLILSLLYDPLGAAMLMVVGIVSFFVHLFSIGYMQGDRRYHIFFANISLFTFAMLGVVLSDNILFFFVFWELMGLMSYLLIGHFAHDPTSSRITHAAAACKKAFLTTRIGDVCLFVGFMIFYFHYREGWEAYATTWDLTGNGFKFTDMWNFAAAEVANNGGHYPTWMHASGLMIFGGTVGKSAQFPLHIWLPDAMEGPTPVSAMIHAATMVAAGVFLLGRTYPLMSPEVLTIVAVVGSFTALFAATIGMTVNDIKGVLAYSTISQLGFMVAAVGCGGVIAGMFHMVTHAFFKSCLFLSAGSVIHGCHHEQDMRKMGGLRKFMPWTFLAMFVSTLAIAGVPFFSGFYSKDMIIQSAFMSGMGGKIGGAQIFAMVALPLAAAMTAFYMFRLIFMTFFGEYRGGHEEHVHDLSDGHAHDHDEHHDDPTVDPLSTGAHGHDDHGSHMPHESPSPMVISLACLALLGFLGGSFWLVGPARGAWFTKSNSVDRLYPAAVVSAIPRLALESEASLAEVREHELIAEGADSEAVHHALEEEYSAGAVAHLHQKHSAHSMAVMVSLTVAGLGILFAYLIYHRRRWDPAVITDRLGVAYTTVRDKYYIDELVNATLIKLTMALSRVLKLFDEYVIDGAVLMVGRVNKGLGFASAAFDRVVVDGIVNLMALASQALGAVVRLFQTGRIQQYAGFAVAGGLALAAFVILV